MNGKFALLMLAIIPLHCAFTSKCKNTWQVWATHVGFPDTSFGDKWKNVFPPWWNLSLGVWKTSETNTKSQYRLCNCLCSLLFCLFLGLRLLKNKCPLSSIPPPPTQPKRLTTSTPDVSLVLWAEHLCMTIRPCDCTSLQLKRLRAVLKRINHKFFFHFAVWSLCKYLEGFHVSGVEFW